jgi:hypothetical protein
MQKHLGESQLCIGYFFSPKNVVYFILAGSCVLVYVYLILHEVLSLWYKIII